MSTRIVTVSLGSATLARHANIDNSGRCFVVSTICAMNTCKRAARRKTSCGAHDLCHGQIVAVSMAFLPREENKNPLAMAQTCCAWLLVGCSRVSAHAHNRRRINVMEARIDGGMGRWLQWSSAVAFCDSPCCNINCAATVFHGSEASTSASRNSWHMLDNAIQDMS